MKIAILGWGSLIYRPGDMLLEGNWQPGGPVLKIEFSRISSDGRLTLVIDPQHGSDVVTLYVKSGRTDAEDAICDLMIREGTTKSNIGVCNKEGAQIENHPDVETKIRAWLNTAGFDTAIWTDLNSNYRTKQNCEFSIDDAFNYLESLPPICKANARDYILKAPTQTETALRVHLKQKGWL